MMRWALEVETQIVGESRAMNSQEKSMGEG